MKRRGWIGSSFLLVSLAAVGVGLAVWKQASLARADAASADQPEPAESVAVAVARPREHRQTTTSIGTVLALRSITLRNEVPGTVREVALVPGQIVEPGTLLVALDVSVERAELAGYEAQAALAQSLLDRVRNMSRSQVASDTELDRARAELDVARAQVDRVKAIIDRKTIRAPFRAKVGLADLHVGQYLEEGRLLTTLQGVDEAAHVDFTVAQRVAQVLRPGDAVEVFRVAGAAEAKPIAATVVAVDARIDPDTRNAAVRGRIAAGDDAPSPGASVRVRVPVGPPAKVVAVPVSALRKRPEGDHGFVVAPDDAGKSRAALRRVRAGAIVGDEVLIHDGLAAGERVATTGSFKLREDVLVAVADATGASASAAK